MKGKSPLIGILKRQTFVIVSCLIVVVMSTVLVSTAVFSTTKSSNKTNTVQTGTFSVNYSNGSNITSTVYVSSDEEGMKSSGKTFSVSRSGSIISSYEILLL